MRESQCREFDLQIILDSLREFHASEPKFPADPAEQERRLGLIRQDPVLLGLRQKYNVAADDAKMDLGFRMFVRRWNIMTNPNPEELIAQANEVPGSK